MRWARIDHAGSPTYAIVDGDSLVPVRGSPFATWERTATMLPLAGTKLLPPVIPPTLYACGMNYAEHVRAVAARIGQEPNLPKRAEIGYRANNALIGPGDPIVIPADATDKVQYEGELVVVIGQKCKHLTRDNAMQAVFGYTIGNDVSERSWQKSDRTMYRSKNTDTFKPMGPWIETDARPEEMVTKVRLNGKEIISFETNNMVFGIVDYLVAMTQYVTLYPGDMIWMGTEGECADMKHGDVCEVEISGLGVLSNPVVREGV